jgi:hypothetical protein
MVHLYEKRYISGPNEDFFSCHQPVKIKNIYVEILIIGDNVNMLGVVTKEKNFLDQEKSKMKRIDRNNKYDVQSFCG